MQPIYEVDFVELLSVSFLLGVYGNLFSQNKEAAFSNYRLWRALGYVIGFAYSTYLCTSIKTYILTSVLVFGVFCYYMLEYLLIGNQISLKPESHRGQNYIDNNALT